MNRVLSDLRIYLLSTLSFFVVLEVLLRVFYSVSHAPQLNSIAGRSAHSNISSMTDRSRPRYVESSPSFRAEIESNHSLKVAVFGGSSASGYGSSLNFSEILSQFPSSKDFIFHNYAVPGAPFAGFQSKLATLLAPYYDFIIIYAGHNELWSHAYLSAKDARSDFILPGGEVISYQDSLKYHDQYDQRKRLLSNLFKPQPSSAQHIGGIGVFIFSNSHFVGVLEYIAQYVRARTLSLRSIQYQSEDLVGQEKPLNIVPLTLSNEFLKPSSRKKILDNFSNALVDVLLSAESHGNKVIVSTVTANLLYPPTSRYIQRDTLNTQLTAKNIQSAYLRISKLQQLEDTLTHHSTDDSHYFYFQAYSCLPAGSIDLSSSQALAPSCLDLFKRSHELDSVPFRSLPGLNSRIISLKDEFPSLIFVDSNRRFLDLSTSVSGHLSLFSDHLHPSSLGHAEIAALIAPHIYDYSLSNSEVSLGKGCSVVIQNDVLSASFFPTADQIRVSRLTSSSFLRQMSLARANPFINNLYLRRLDANPAYCP